MLKSLNAIKRRLNLPVMAYGTVLLFVFFCIITNGRIATPANILLILRNASVLSLASIGMTLVILISQVDISIGPLMSLSGVVAAAVLNGGLPLGFAIICALLTGVAIGLLNGVLVALFKFDYWISTFATMGICSGLALVVANGGTVRIENAAFDWLGNGKIAGVYVMIWLTVIIILAVIWMLRKTRFGYNIYSIGGSEICARLSGLNVEKNRVLVYICSGFFAAVAGLVMSAMSCSANPIGGANYSFDAMAAVIIGGTGFSGGRGGLTGTVLGALMLRILSNGLGCLNIPATWQKAIIGIAIVAVLVVDALGTKRRKQNDLRRVYTK